MFSDALRYFHTLRHLKTVQIGGRLRRAVYRPQVPGGLAPSLRERAGPWPEGAEREASLLGPARLRFLNEAHDVAGAEGWNDPRRDKLWLYNLHYFDDLNARDAPDRMEWQRAILSRWIAENPPASGTGWEPYPASLRIVNWICWMMRHPERVESGWLDSLAIQARWLARNLEWHLLGNHLFVNAKALVHAGAFFRGAEADAWMRKGLAILEREMPEQILADGGQFERSPMYHALALEDMLDLIRVAEAFPDAMPEAQSGLASAWRETASRMLAWLRCLCHPDGEVGFFNDSAIDVAPAPAELERYAARLGIDAGSCGPGLRLLADSGYARMEAGPAVALLDVAPVGPDYLPGHAHADTLSFELSLHGGRVLVNSGTSVYGSGAERQRQRGTAAHNTVVVDDEDSSEVWAGFRVARRARPFGLAWREDEGAMSVTCSHDGYRRLPGRPVHTRSWSLAADSLVVEDVVRGSFRRALARFHVHPDLVVEPCAAGELRIGDRAGRWIRVRARGASLAIGETTWHPRFGVSLANRCIEASFDESSCRTEFCWG